MNNQFDELTKSMAQSLTRRRALQKFSIGLVGMALACFGLANKARAADACQTNKDCSVWGKYVVCCKLKSGNVCVDKVFCRGKGGGF